MRDKEIFSDGQDLSTAVAATGVASDNIFDMELDGAAGNEIITNDQIDAFVNVQLLSTTNTGASGGMDVEIRSSDTNDLETSDIPIAKIHFTASELLTAAMPIQKSIKVLATLSQKFFGVWYMPITTNLTGETIVDAWISAVPDGSPNEGIQKIPS